MASTCITTSPQLFQPTMAITGATFAASAQLRSSRCPASTPLRSGIRRDEIKQLARRLQQVSRNGFSKVELRSMFTDLTFNIVMRMIAGKRYYGEDVNLIEETNTFKETMKEYADLGGLTNLADVFPIIQCVDYNGFVRKCVGLGKRMDLILQGLIDEHRRDKDRNTMINHLLTLQDSQPDQYYTEDIIKGLVLVSGLSFHLLVLVHMPFGMGRRACPGEGLAQRVMAVTLGSFIQCFEWEKVDGKDIDMAEKMHTLMCRVEPIEAMCRVRPHMVDLLF